MKKCHDVAVKTKKESDVWLIHVTDNQTPDENDRIKPKVVI